MSLVINHNLMAMNAARNLGIIFNRLSTSTQRLSSGLRINSAGDDAAGLAIRELMRADILVMQQGIRNASDGISMIQTAEGAMAVIDEKLTRMKELAEQAATGTYTTAQRQIMNSEYQAMAREIDRIANATYFNGTKLLDGSISNIHEGSGMKIHFGTGNSAAEDYYFVTIGDVRATSTNGLHIGGDAKNDIWGPGGGEVGQAGACCGGQITSLNQAYFGSGEAFAFAYNYLATDNLTEADIQTPSYLAGTYFQSSGGSLQDLIDSVNAGTQSRIQVNFGTGAGTSGDVADLNLGGSGAALNICLGDEVFQFTSGTAANTNGLDAGSTVTVIDIHGAFSGAAAASALAATINSASSTYWAVASAGAGTLHIFFRAGGDNDDVQGCDLGVSSGTATADDAARLVTWTNMETYAVNSAGTMFANGGEDWARLVAQQLSNSWTVSLQGQNFAENYDLSILDVDTLLLPTAVSGTNWTNLRGIGSNFAEIQNASDGAWEGAHIRTQSSAQEALAALDDAILRKDIVRANLGAIQNRLENTITNLGIQAENLQASESRISDVDVASEMTELTRNNILAQAATAMLSQANSLPQLALSLLQ